MPLSTGPWTPDALQNNNGENMENAWYIIYIYMIYMICMWQVCHQYTKVAWMIATLSNIIKYYQCFQTYQHRQYWIYWPEGLTVNCGPEESSSASLSQCHGMTAPSPRSWTTWWPSSAQDWCRRHWSQHLAPKPAPAKGVCVWIDACGHDGHVFHVCYFGYKCHKINNIYKYL